MDDSKNEIREKVWKVMEEEGVALFPGARGRIPNFRGAEKAAHLLPKLTEWQRAIHIKFNPDSPQEPVRRDARRLAATRSLSVLRLPESPFLIAAMPHGNMFDIS